MKFDEKRILASALAAVFLTGSFVWLGRVSCVTSSFTVAVDLKAPAPIACQLFYAEKEQDPFTPERSRTVLVGPGGARIEFELPASSLERLRVDFGTGEVPVRASAIRVFGRESRTLDWRDFTVRHDIARFEVDGKGAVDVGVSGGDPYATHRKRLGMEPAVRISGFSVLCLVLFAFLAWWPLAGPDGLLWNASPRDGESVRSRPFLLLALLLVAARFALSARLPPFFARSPWDDLWLLNSADGLLRGQWMGPYDHHTLTKGCFGPMVLALSAVLGVPYLIVETALYVLSCLFFVGVASRLSRNRLFLAAALALLLFNPASFSEGAFQRVHRNGMPLWQVPFLFGCLYLLFLDCKKSWRAILCRAVAAGGVLWMVQNTREDGIWLWPFVLVCLAFSAVRAWRGGATRRTRTARALLCAVPLAVFLLGNAAVCLVNWYFYGLPLRNDRDAGNYAKAMRDLYLIRPDPVDDARLSGPQHAGHYHGLYWSTICQAFEASPTFRQARPQIEVCFDQWSKNAHYHDRELFEDKPLFALRNGAAAAGFYSSLRTSERFWGDVHEELSAAFDAGRLQSRGFSFTAMCAPFRMEFVPRIFDEWRRAIAFVAHFRDLRAAPSHSEPFWELTAWNDRLRMVSGERFLPPDKVASERPYIDRANRVGRVYEVAMPWMLVASFAALVVLTALLVLKRERRSDTGLWAAWLLAVGIAASFFVHTACIAYVSATTFEATLGAYMAASYQLSLLFVVVVAGLAIRLPGLVLFGTEAKREKR